MSYDTKVILLAVAEIIVSKRTKKEIYDSVARIANAEGVIMASYDEAIKDEPRKDEKKE